MTERTMPTLFVREVLGAHADDPAYAKIGLRIVGETGLTEVQVAVPACHLDAFVGALITAKGYFDWPPPTRTSTTASLRPRSMLGTDWSL
jgi:hypothetical protein